MLSSHGHRVLRRVPIVVIVVVRVAVVGVFQDHLGRLCMHLLVKWDKVVVIQSQSFAAPMRLHRCHDFVELV